MARNFGAGGTNDRVVYNDASGRIIPFSHKHTVAGWCYRTADPVTTWRFAQESDINGLTRWYIAANNNGSQGPVPGWRYYIFSAGVYLESWIFPWPALNTWSHIAVSHDTEVVGTWPTCYVNGVVQSLQRYDSFNTAIPATNSVLRMGNANAGGSGWPGKGQNISNWNVILTQAEITALARGVSPHRIRTRNLLWHFPMFQTNEEGDWAGGRIGERYGTTVEPGRLPSGPMIVV